MIGRLNEPRSSQRSSSTGTLFTWPVRETVGWEGYGAGVPDLDPRL